jgi:hypothetical protein
MILPQIVAYFEADHSLVLLQIYKLHPKHTGDRQAPEQGLGVLPLLGS